MFIIGLFRRMRCISLVLFLLVISVASAHCITMDTTVGFDGVVKSGCWTPVAVRIVNEDAVSINGKLAVIAGGPPTSATCLAEVQMPPNSKKLYHVYTQMSEYGGSVTVALANIKKASNISLASETDVVVVNIGPRSARLNYLNGETVQMPNPPGWVAPPAPPGAPAPAPPSSRIYVGSLSPEDLPDRPAAYEGADVVVLTDFAPSSATPKALKALSMWAASGGTIIVSTGADYKRFQNDFYDELLPVNITGTTTLDGLTSIAKSGRAFPAQPVAVAQSSLKQGVGELRFSQNNIPVVATRQYGSGRVVYLAFDQQSDAIRRWDGQIDFWKDIIATSSSQPLIVSSSGALMNRNHYYQQWDDSQRWGLISLLGQDPEVKMPSFNVILIFLIVYLFVMSPLNYHVLRRKQRLDLAWITTPLIALVFTLGAYGMGYTMKGGKLLIREVTFVEASSHVRYARTITAANLFSPAKKLYSVEAMDPYSIVQAIPTDERTRIPMAFLSERPTIEKVDIPMWSSRPFESISGTDLGGALETDLVLTGGVLTGSVRNNTKIDLTKCSIVYGGNSVHLGDLPKGRSKQVQVEGFLIPSSPGHGGGWNPFIQQAERLEESLPKFAETVLSKSNTPILVGYAKGGGVFRPVGLSARDERSTVYAFRLTHKYGTAAATPKVMLRDDFAYSNGELNGSGGWRGSGVDIDVRDQLVLIRGGAHSAECARTAPIARPASGQFTVVFKARPGNGNQTMWDFRVEDHSGRNLARWYGSGGSARGRIADTNMVTETHALEEGWNDLKVVIDTNANTSTYFVNGSRIGVLSHESTGAGDEIGVIKIGRIDNHLAQGDYIHLDKLSIQ